MLFAVFGVDLESVTVIVSVFMFGLGVGALLGGVVADRFGGRLLIIFAGVELGIGMFGFFSPGLIDLLNASVAGSDRVVAALGSFAVLAIPTTLMGGTLPVLVTHVNRFDPHIGQAVGQLYFANTAGAAVGAYLVGYHLLRWVDLTGAIHTAAGINVLVAVTALVAFGRK
jgi:MFS family permease